MASSNPRSCESRSQKQQILQHLKRAGRLTPMFALNRFGCYRLAARIQELREDGIQIETVRADKGHAIYLLK